MMKGKTNIDTLRSECIHWTVKAVLEQGCPEVDRPVGGVDVLGDKGW